MCKNKIYKNKSIIKKLFIFFIIFITIFFSGCIKYYDLSKYEFNQGKDLPDQRDVVYNNISSVSIYDQFETLAKFDCLWLSDQTRKAYIDLMCLKEGKNDNERLTLLSRQLEENKHWIGFYVLADVRDKVHPSLSEKNSCWSFYLTMDDGTKIAPSNIKEIELEPEYKTIFGPRFNLFKRSYLIKFAIAKPDGQINPDFTLFVSSSGKYSPILFGSKKDAQAKKKDKYFKKEVYKDEDYYWV